MKTCTGCQKELPLDSFYLRKSGPKAGKPMDAKCKQCYGQRVKGFADANRGAVRVANRVASAKFRDANKDRERQRTLAAYYANRERCLARGRAWREANLDRKAAKESKRRATKLSAIPVWADLSKIKLIYAAAKEEERRTGVKMHVDHIVPLQHELVCGLHCEANLQILPASQNLSKSNRWWPAMP